MNLQNIATDLLERIEKLLGDENKKQANAMPEGCYFLDKDTVVCLPRTTGDARYPYSADGFNLWAYSSGYVSINESTFYVILSSDEGKEPYLNFYAGQDLGNGKYAPVSLLGIAASPLESEVERYTVYTPQAVYYLTKTRDIIYCVRMFVDGDKKVYFSLTAENITTKAVKTYLSSYFNCFLMHASGECVETKWFKECKTHKNGFTFYSVEDLSRTEHLHNYGVITRAIDGMTAYNLTSTTSHMDYTGGKNIYLAASKSLFEGGFEREKPATKFTETAIAGDMLTFSLNKNQSIRVDYALDVFFDGDSAKDGEAVKICANETDEKLVFLQQRDNERQNSVSALKICFQEEKDTLLKANVLEKFIGFVQRQVEFAALSKNSGVSLLGVRDVFQQIESALMWNPTACRAKIIEALDFIGENGRPPRQYSIPPKDGIVPPMDLRKFIDQGVWIINVVYRYLAYTGDVSILKEICGYYILDGVVSRSERKDTVLDHLIQICRYLTDNIDEDTGCLKVLYGDWNDALDGMGASLDGSTEFGNGVSVMATLQLYQNIGEMREILKLAGVEDTLSLDGQEEKLKNGLQKYALVADKSGRRILHGWGDKRSYLVGSEADSDGQDRVGLTSNAFWVLSGAYDWDKSVKNDILRAYDRLDSKYGLKTFEPFFAKDAQGVGRIVNLPKGTAENSASYVHATLFGVWSLFKMGECERAWKQLEKALPVTHEHISTTQFVMSNSYSYNEEFEMDGESMSDWYTGSANVLIKMLVRDVFGIDARIDGLYIHPCKYFPFKKASIRIKVREAIVRLSYENIGGKKRSISTNVEGRYEVIEDGLFVSADKLNGDISVRVID